MKTETLSRAILLGGCARSGTTITGKLLGSLEGVEYFFEPAFLHKFIWQLGKMENAAWKKVFGAYAYDDLLLGAIAGRNLNFNRNDDSCIYNVKAEEEIATRMSRSHRKLELEAAAKGHTLSFKIPDLVFKVPEFQTLYPGIRAVAMVRHPGDVIASLIKKEWFTDSALHIDSPAPQIDFEVVGAYRVPMWVERHQVDFWMEASAEKRCTYYYCRINEWLLAFQDSFHFVVYDELVAQPQAVLNRLCDSLNLKPGALTSKVLGSIRPKGSAPKTLPESIGEEFVWRIEEIQKDYETLLGENIFNPQSTEKA